MLFGKAGVVMTKCMGCGKKVTDTDVAFGRSIIDHDGDVFCNESFDILPRLKPWDSSFND